MEISRIIEVLSTEKECVLRQDIPLSEGEQCRKDDDGVKLCELCDLCLPTEDVITAYEESISLLQNIRLARFNAHALNELLKEADNDL